MKKGCSSARMGWRVVTLFLWMVCVGWPPAASAASVYGGHGTVLNVIYPELWDPHMAGTIGPLAALSPLYNQLVEFNPLPNPDEIIGDLATRWEVSEDGLTYTFYLHDNVKWWDGKNLTAEDVVFSLKRMVEPGKPRPRVGLLRPYIKDVHMVDRLTVVVEAGVDINVSENIVGRGSSLYWQPPSNVEHFFGKVFHPIRKVFWLTHKGEGL